MTTARVENPFHLPIETSRAKPTLWCQVKTLISQFGGHTHAELTLEKGARKIVQESTLLEEARDFLLDVIGADRLVITLHISEAGETPYYEVSAGRARSLRGLQCYGFPNEKVLTVSTRQNFDPTTSAPINPESTGRLNKRLTQDEESPFNITTSLLKIIIKLAADKPQELSVVAS